MMNDQLISFETAKLAKEKGFKERSNYYYSINDEVPEVRSVESYVDMNTSNWAYQAVTQSQLRKWLRDKFDCYVEVEVPYFSELENDFKITIKKEEGFDWYVAMPDHFDESWSYDDPEYATYEEALEAGLQEALKVIQK